MEIKSAMCSIVTGHKKENKKYEKSRLKKTCFFQFARHGRALTGVSPEHAQIVGSV